MDLPIHTAASSPRPTPSPSSLPVSASPTSAARHGSDCAPSPFSLASSASLPPSIIQRRPSLSSPLPASSCVKPAQASAPSPSTVPTPAAVNGLYSASSREAAEALTPASAAELAARRYTPENILLTGGAGFIGSNVMLYLVQRYPQYRLVCLDKLEYCATVNNFAAIRQCSNFTFIKGDICSLDLVSHVLASYRIDTILHFAAQTHVDNSFGLALDFTRTNIFGTHVLLEASKHIHPQIRRFIHVSTDEVYGESLLSSRTRLTESSQLNPSNPYAATKVAAEYLVRSYAHSFSLPSIITRGNNVYGPHQYPEKLIPKFINLLARGLPCPLHGDGSHLRSYLYIDDVSRAFECILHYGEEATIYNIGSDSEISNRDVLCSLLAAFGLPALGHGGERYVQHVRDRPYNDLRYFIDTSSLKALGWSKQVAWEDGIRRTIDWYRQHQGHWGDIGDALAAHPRVELKVAAEE